MSRFTQIEARARESAEAKGPWKSVATAIGDGWIGQLWKRESPEGDLFRISHRYPVGEHGYAHWMQVAARRKVFIRWPSGSPQA